MDLVKDNVTLFIQNGYTDIERIPKALLESAIYYDDDLEIARFIVESNAVKLNKQKSLFANSRY